jgi:hypothetical protein
VRLGRDKAEAGARRNQKIHERTAGASPQPAEILTREYQISLIQAHQAAASVFELLVSILTRHADDGRIALRGY